MIKTARKQNSQVVAAKTNAAALGELYEKYYPRVLRFCVLRLFNQDLAEEVVSMVFLDVASNMGRFRGNSEPEFTAWLFRIATNHCHNAVRKKVRRQRIMDQVQAELEPSSAAADAPFESQDDHWPLVYDALARLKPLEQTVITLRYFEKLEYEQIAEIVKRRPSTVRVLHHRGLNKLRCQLEEKLGGGLSCS